MPSEKKRTRGEIRRDLKRDLERLKKKLDSNNEDVEGLRNQVKKVHRELYEFEEIEEENTKTNFKTLDEDSDSAKIHQDEKDTINETINNYEVKKKIVLKKRRMSKSFANWMFNNKEV